MTPKAEGVHTHLNIMTLLLSSTYSKRGFVGGWPHSLQHCDTLVIFNLLKKRLCRRVTTLTSTLWQSYDLQLTQKEALSEGDHTHFNIVTLLLSSTYSKRGFVWGWPHSLQHCEGLMIFNLLKKRLCLRVSILTSTLWQSYDLQLTQKEALSEGDHTHFNIVTVLWSSTYSKRDFVWGRPDSPQHCDTVVIFNLLKGALLERKYLTDSMPVLTHNQSSKTCGGPKALTCTTV